jgi:outer membrane protein TolC
LLPRRARAGIRKPSPWWRGFLVLALLAASSCLTAAEPLPSPLGLEQAIDIALQGNRNLRRVSLAVDSSNLHAASAATEFQTNIGPDVMVTSGEGQTFVRYGPRISRKLASGTVLALSAGVVTTTGDGQTDNTGSVRVEIEQPLFRRFGKLAQQHALHLTNSNIRTTQRNLEREKAQLVLAVIRAYETVVRLQQQVDADREAIRQVEALQLAARTLGGTRGSDGLDAMGAELMLGEARLRLDGDLQQLAATQRELAELLGHPPETTLVLEAAVPLELAADSADQAVQVALQNRLDLAQALQDHTDALRAVTVAERGLMPDLRLRASYDDFATSMTSVGAVPLGQEVWFLSLTGPTDFNLTRERLNVAQARLQAESAQLAIETLESSIRREVLQRYHAHRQAIERARLAGRNMLVADNRALLARQRLSLGHADRFATANAEAARSAATLAALAARAEVSISACELSLAMGTLLDAPDELKPTLYRATP